MLFVFLLLILILTNRFLKNILLLRLTVILWNVWLNCHLLLLSLKYPYLEYKRDFHKVGENGIHKNQLMFQKTSAGQRQLMFNTTYFYFLFYSIFLCFTYILHLVVKWYNKLPVSKSKFFLWLNRNKLHVIFFNVHGFWVKNNGAN